MKQDNFIITEFSNIFEANNAKGKIFEWESRYCSCFIVTFSGSLRFTYEGGSIVADSSHPVFIPEGLTYKNECIKDAKSLVFNFHTLEKYSEPAVLSQISHRFATEKYEEIEKALVFGSAESRMTVLSALYALASELFAAPKKNSASSLVLAKATEYICSNYSRPTLTVSEVASECFVSEIYLRKLFAKKLGTTPFSFVTKTRMTRARNLLKEKIPVKEIALSVGYTDIYQFSRAYKKHFGYPPSETV